MIQHSQSLRIFSVLIAIPVEMLGLRTVVIEIHAGRSIRGSSEAPERYKSQDVAKAMRALVVHNRTSVAEGV